MGTHRWMNWVMLTAAVMMVASMATTAMADYDGYLNYGRIGIGANQPTDDLDDNGYDAGINATFAYGRYLSRYLAIEGVLNHFSSDNDVSGSTPTAGNYDREDTLSVSSLLVTLKGEIPVGAVRLFAGVGVGGYVAYLDSKVDTANRGRYRVEESDTVFGTHVVAGGSYDITPRIFLGIEGMYRWTGDVNISETVRTVPVELDADLNGYSIVFSGGFRF